MFKGSRLIAVLAIAGALVVGGAPFGSAPVMGATLPPPVTRSFSGQAVAAAAGNMGSCSGVYVVVVQRPNIPDWRANGTGCVYPVRGASGFVVIGPFTMVTGKGTVMTGVGTIGILNGQVGGNLSIHGSDGEFLGGTLTLTPSTSLPTTIAGSVTVQPKH